jgi:dCTP deaminase
VEGKSSLARIGLGVHVTAPTIHAGFEGLITLEIKNHGTAAIRLRPGMPICQLIFESVFGTPSVVLEGIFQNQQSVSGRGGS